MWKDQPERMLSGHDGRSNIVFDEAGTIYCYDKVSDPPVRHQMAFIGQEPDRPTLKLRCPAPPRIRPRALYRPRRCTIIRMPAQLPPHGWARAAGYNAIGLPCWFSLDTPACP